MKQLLNKITLRETDKLSEAEILFRNCPQDNLAGHVEQLMNNIRQGKTKLWNVLKDGQEIGFVACEVYNNEFVIVAMHANNSDPFKTVVPAFEESAKNIGCKCLTFSTVRSGLIKQGLNEGFVLSEVVLRKYL